MQVSLRAFDEQLNVPSIRPSAGPQPTVKVDHPDLQPLPERVQQPVDEAPSIELSVRPEAVEPPVQNLTEIRPEMTPLESFERTPVNPDISERVIMPRPTIEDRLEPVESLQPFTPQAPPEPQRLDIRPPDRGAIPISVAEVPERTPMSEQSSSVERLEPVQRPEERPLPEIQPTDRPDPQQVPASSPQRPETEIRSQPDRSSSPVAPQLGNEPQRPVPPPTYGSSLQFPRPGTIDPPKRMISIEVETVSVRIMYNDRGEIVGTELIAETASTDEAVNDEAPLYARYNVEITEPAPAGQICQATVHVTFSPVGGTSFSFSDAADRVQCFVP